MKPTRREFGELAFASQIPAPPSKRVNVRQSGAVVDVSIDGKQFAVYNFDTSHAGAYRPFFHPLFGANSKPITQNGQFPGTLRSHYWHRALFIAHQKVNGISYWEERQADCGKIAHVAFDELTAGNQLGRLVERLAWRDVQGKDVLRETRTVHIPHRPASRRVLDLELRFSAAAGAVQFAATPYNLLACKVIDAMCLLSTKEQQKRRFASLADFSPTGEGGRISNSEGKQNEECGGARARWCDFSGPLGDGTWGGVSLMDHPSNPRHPTYWHNWNNITIIASFTYKELYLLRPGQELVLKYRVLVHSGGAREADVDSEWKSFAGVAAK